MGAFPGGLAGVPGPPVQKPFTPRQHLWLLRGAIFCVALTIFIFSVLYQPTQYVQMFLAISGGDEASEGAVW